MVNLAFALLSYIVVSVCLAFGAFSAHAQTYPNKPIRYVVGFTGGTATDLVARLVSARLSERWGQQVIVDNRVGAAGTIGAGLVAKSTPDGYTLYMASSTMVVSPYFMDGVTYDVFKDFSPVDAVVRGDVAMYYPNLAGAMPLIKQGRVKALALSTAKRSAAAPEIATMAESVPGFDSMSFYGIVVPAKTPKDVIAKLNAEVNAVIAEPDMRKRLQDVGGDVIGGAPDVLTARMKTERDQVSQVVKRIQAGEGRK